MGANPDQSPLQQKGYDFMAACFEVYNELGHGFLEEVYQESVEIELTERGIPFISQPKLQLFYKTIPASNGSAESSNSPTLMPIRVH